MGNKIDVPSRKYGFFPHLIHMRGMEFSVTCVEGCWTTGKGDKMERHYFDVTTDNGRFVVYEDLKKNQWYVEG